MWIGNILKKFWKIKSKLLYYHLYKSMDIYRARSSDNLEEEGEVEITTGPADGGDEFESEAELQLQLTSVETTTQLRPVIL